MRPGTTATGELLQHPAPPNDELDWTTYSTSLISRNVHGSTVPGRQARRDTPTCGEAAVMAALPQHRHMLQCTDMFDAVRRFFADTTRTGA